MFGELYGNFPMSREEMSLEEEREFVEECFKIYENKGFAEVFRGNGGVYAEYDGQIFELLGRSNEEVGIENLPMWRIKFKDGFILDVYHDEVINVN